MSDTTKDLVIHGLGQPRKTLPCKLLYDEVGAALFEEICTLPEYYVTRTELSIMHAHAHEMAAHIGSNARIVELGSGESIKTRLLLDRLRDVALYVLVDISQEQLLHTTALLARDYPRVEFAPVCADYTKHLELPRASSTMARTVVYFPGSTLGNFVPAEALAFLRWIAALGGKGAGLLLGIDLEKDPALLHAAYNDASGVTARFNENLLVRINRELGADFALGRFHHEARWNAEQGRIEMHLVSDATQTVGIDAQRFAFTVGETILTEYSYKYRLPDFAAMAKAAGFEMRHTWTDPLGHFAVIDLEAVV